jgi:hypothetical protein
MHMSAAEAANFLATPRTWIEASSSHYTCFGHSVGRLEDLPDHTPMGGTVQAETLHQAAFLLVRASQNREEIGKKIEAQRSNPRDARLVARKAGAAAAAAKKGVVKNIKKTRQHQRQDQNARESRPGPPQQTAYPSRGAMQRRHRAQKGPPGGGAKDIRRLSPKGGGRGGGTISAPSPQRGRRTEENEIRESPPERGRGLEETKTRGQPTRWRLSSTETGIGVGHRCRST